MRFTEAYAVWFKRLLPSPFSIALILTVLTVVLSLFVSEKSLVETSIAWQKGLWQPNLLAFAFQMMLMLVLGHALALSSFFTRLVDRLSARVKTNAQAAITITFTTLIVAFFNWGLALIYGAIITRKIGESLSKRQIAFNYPLLGACGYVGLMVWHGGLSGSALTKVAEKGHIVEISGNEKLPEFISYADTVFSGLNTFTFLFVVVLVSGYAWYLAKRVKTKKTNIEELAVEPVQSKQFEGAERIDHSSVVSKSIGAVFVLVAVLVGVLYAGHTLGFINPDYINFSLLGLGLLLHKNFNAFTNAVENAIVGSTGILIQFPLYFGILALMQSSGLITIVSDWFIANATATTLPIYTFFSAGLVNIFVPSGGGQWAIQGPIILEAAQQLNVPLNKAVLALAYGDQITNMLQPFWALPLLGNTGLKAQQILPYTLLFMVIGSVVFITGLLIF
jgi:short-chain fatty acids transporter